jgi:hypothetical protein
MKQFLIKYRHTNGSTEDWHREIGQFIAAIDGDPALAGKVGYRCLKARDGADYFHIATVHDDSGRIALQETLRRYPEWEVDQDNIVRLHTSTVRGFAQVPIRV